jgi:cell wall-associated NlpC family hydrolase
MQIGDLLVFSRRNNPRISHVGMYVGNARMVHASSVRKAVVEVSLSKYSGMQLRSVRRVVAIDSTSNDDAVPRLR